MKLVEVTILQRNSFLRWYRHLFISWTRLFDSLVGILTFGVVRTDLTMKYVKWDCRRVIKKRGG